MDRSQLRDFHPACTPTEGLCAEIGALLSRSRRERRPCGRDAFIALLAGVPALRIYFSMFLFMSLQLAGQGAFVGLGRSKQAVFFSLLRKAIVNAPLTVLLALWMGADGVFTAEAVSQLVGGLACFTTMYLTVYRPLGRLADGEAGP